MIVNTGELELGVEPVFKVKEYELKISELEKILETNETLSLEVAQEDNGQIRHSFKITFHDTDGKSPSISITSSLISSGDESTNQSHFSTVKINLHQNKAYPENVKFFSGIQTNSKNTTT
ncbi:unnamed protein product [Brachionus calyciflorus]|uniref:Uncharacterized protein n=1 Tax=Brachionus calyciflorus TaxID=104777 RepID=A0A814HQ49_9BILA|nr:unnamed protein product [Brachionus calyciflorus]